MKHYADQRRDPTPEFQPGDLVLLNVKNFRLQSGLCRKLAPRFIGPFKVQKSASKAKQAYRLELPANLKIHPVFHVSALKAYKYFPDNYTPPPLPSVIDGHVEYEVDCVTKTMKEGKHREYLVHWAGYNESTWENVKNLTNCPEKLSEFWAAKGMPCPHPVPYRVVHGAGSTYPNGLLGTNRLPPGELCHDLQACRLMTGDNSTWQYI
jgi:hypothetical protein